MSVFPKFEVRFDAGAYHEYTQLDGSLAALVDKKLEELECRADDVGKPLGSTAHAKLAGCREIKMRDAGVRIVYRVTDQKVDVLLVAFILAIEKRADNYVFALAGTRNACLRQLSVESLKEKLKNAPTREPKKRK